jgi:hypothetical protein
MRRSDPWAAAGRTRAMTIERARIWGTNTMSLVKSVWPPALRVSTATVLLCAWFLSATATISRADESGNSFWLPGTFGSLAATPGQPGWAFAAVYYHTSVSVGADVARSRELQIGRFNPNLNVNLNAISISDSVTGFGDLYPQASLKWNSGVNNFMTYVTGDIPVGDYSSTRLANLGLGHGAIDGGAGYTYFNPATGREFSAVTGLTYNFTRSAICRDI